MNFQFYDSLRDKSEKHLLYLCNYIEPKFTASELKFFLDDISKMPTPDKKEGKEKIMKNFIAIGEDTDTIGDLSSLNLDQLKAMFQIFISREINSKLAIKWRFYQFLKFFPNLIIESVRINQHSNSEQFLDIIVETGDSKCFLIACVDILDSDKYNKVLIEIKDFIIHNNIMIQKIILSACKMYRNIPVQNSVDINEEKIIPELWLEYVEDSPFNGEDLVIVNNNEVELAGFNFISMQDLLNYVYESVEGGQISIFKQQGFFLEEDNQEEPQVELIWKGIMVKSKS